MKRFEHITTVVATLLAGMSLLSCIYDYEPEAEYMSNSIRVNTLAVSGTAAGEDDDTFMVLFWHDSGQLESPSSAADWSAPYLAGHAPRPVAFYEHSVFDTRYPYPQDDTYLYATGYAPGNVLAPDAEHGYRRLTSAAGDAAARYDFLGCDAWSDVFRGSQSDPFAQDKNKLYFRHLTSKLVFYADRDKEMENRQFVRNVQVKNLQMSVAGGEWTPMYTPSAFEWKTLTPADFTESYKQVVARVKLIEGNTGVTTDPAAGYVTVEAEPFAGENSDFVLQRNTGDRVPIDGMSIDSCYVCSPIDEAGVVSTGNIRLKMDISAEMSFDPNFPMTDGDSATDDLTFTRVWRGVTVDAIYKVEVDAAGNVQTKNERVTEFEAGCEYRVYIRFNRTGVNLVAKELPWNFNGVHYITIPGGDQSSDDQSSDEQSGDEQSGGGRQDETQANVSGKPGHGQTRLSCAGAGKGA